MRTHATRGPLQDGPGPLCKTYAMGDAITDHLRKVDCIRCRDLLMEPVRLRRREPAEIAAYFDGALAALHFVKGRASSVDGLRVVDVDGMIALFEASAQVRP